MKVSWLLIHCFSNLVDFPDKVVPGEVVGMGEQPVVPQTWPSLASQETTMHNKLIDGICSDYRDLPKDSSLQP